MSGPNQAAALIVGDVHLWGPGCPCGPTPGIAGTLRHHSLDGTGWTEDRPSERAARARRDRATHEDWRYWTGQNRGEVSS